MRARSPEVIVIAAGGTGGHLFPGIAVADEHRRRHPDARVVFVGTARGLETRLVPRAGYELKLLPIRPLNRVGIARLLVGAAALPWGLWRSLWLVVRLRPRCVLGIGGYAGGPLVLTAALLGVPTMILEPNAQPGLTNRILCPFVRRAACAYSETLAVFGRKGIVTGNPVREGFLNLPPKAHAKPWSVLVFGGSQGSRILNRALVEALPHLPPADELRIVHQTGPVMHAEIVRAYESAKRSADVLPFIDDMPAFFASADLIVARSGATTCAELTVSGKAALLVPFSRAANDHQRFNAHALRAAGAASVLEEVDLNGESLARATREIVLDPERLVAMETAARRLGRSDAASRVEDVIESLTSRSVRSAVDV